MTSWWAPLAPVTLPVTCGGQPHELRWAAGSLAAPAHPDAGRERALAALGADPSLCLQMLEAWNRHADDLDVLLLASRGPSDPLDEAQLRFMSGTSRDVGFTSYRPLPHAMPALGLTMGVRRAGGTGWFSYSGGYPTALSMHSGDEDDSPVDEVAALLALGAGLPQRLVATVLAAWVERTDAGDERVAAATPALDAALYGRLRAALLPWLGRRVTIQFTMQPPGGEASVHRDGDVVRVELPLVWLRDVWANGLAVTLDRFCIRAERTASDTWTLTTLDRELTAPRTVTISG